MSAKEKRGLGVGLAELFGELETSEELTQTMLPIAKVEPRADQPRVSFDEEALEELAQSIAQYGVIQPITVRPLENGFYQIIAGERRWRASRMAGLQEVPVHIMEADDRMTAELALVENLLRQDLNPIEEARGYKTLMEDYGLTQEECSKSVGRSRSAIANSMRLLSLTPEVMSMVENGTISAGHARALLPIQDAERQLAAAKQVTEKLLSVRKVEQLAARLSKEPKEKPVKTGIDYAKECSDELSRLLGRKVRIIENRRTGHIELDYYDSDDREALIDALKKLRK